MSSATSSPNPAPAKAQPKFSAEFGTHRWRIRKRYCRDLATLAPRAKGVMLDIGCGAKPFEQLFAPYVSQHVGVDLPASLDYRGSRAEVNGSATRLPFADGSFDTVLCTQMLDDVPEPSDIFREAARVLRPGGVLILTVGMLYPVHDPPHDFYRFTRYGLEYQAKKAGLTPEHFRASGGAWLAAGTLVVHRIWAIHDRIPLLRKLRFIPAIAGAMVGLFFDLIDRIDPSWAGAPNVMIVARK